MNLLFVCTGNTCRSAMAEGIMKKLCKDKNIKNIFVDSCGISVSGIFRVPEVVLKLAKNDGIDLSNHRPKQIDKQLVEGSDLIFVMENFHKEYIKSFYPEVNDRIFLLKEYVNETEDVEIQDPIGFSNSVYEETFKSLKVCIENILSQIQNNRMEKNK